jgi:hypothetical protein
VPVGSCVMADSYPRTPGIKKSEVNIYLLFLKENVQFNLLMKYVD